MIIPIETIYIDTETHDIIMYPDSITKVSLKEFIKKTIKEVQDVNL